MDCSLVVWAMDVWFTRKKLRGGREVEGGIYESSSLTGGHVKDASDPWVIAVG